MGSPHTPSPPAISVVIPTRNRPESLRQTLATVASQTTPPGEVLIVDSSDTSLSTESLRDAFPSLTLSVLRSHAHVCVQRNKGIRQANGSHILLLDDDIELPDRYLEEICAFLGEHPAIGAVSGLITEPLDSGNFDDGSRNLSLSALCSAFIFQTGVWGDLTTIRAPKGLEGLRRALLAWFRRRGNRFSLGGWPLFTQIQSPASLTAVYGLGAAVVRKEWLLESPFDESLDPHGIGDNYGVCLGFPGDGGISVLTGLAVRHHKSAINRIDPGNAYVLRVKALARFMRGSPRFSWFHGLFLHWSLVGRSIVMTVKGELATAKISITTSWGILFNKKPWSSSPCL